MKREFKFGVPAREGESATRFQLTPVQWRIVAELPTAQASCELTCTIELRSVETDVATGSQKLPS
jgi:hypothetical protein